jgi:hypothetical protein
VLADSVNVIGAPAIADRVIDGDENPATTVAWSLKPQNLAISNAPVRRMTTLAQWLTSSSRTTDLASTQAPQFELRGP